MQDYIEDKRIDGESNITFINAKNESIQSNDINVVILLLKECTEEKKYISNASRSVFYQLYVNQLTGFTTSLLFYHLFSVKLTKLNFEHFLILVTSPMLLLCLSLWVLITNIRKNKLISASVKKKFALFSYSIFSVFLVSLFSVLQSSTYSSLSMIVMLVLDLILIKRFQNLVSATKVIDRNLEKIVRAASQAREHMAIGFGTKAELDIRLTRAEDALENPRLFF
jgi:FlaA1/EpsC-like NDP-sugar epimerase